MRRAAYEMLPPISSSQDSYSQVRIQDGSHPVQPPVNISRVETPQTLQAPVLAFDHFHGDNFFPFMPDQNFPWSNLSPLFFAVHP